MGLLGIFRGMTRHAWFLPLLVIALWPDAASAQWRWVVEKDRFDDAKPTSCGAIQDFANGHIAALPPKNRAEPPSLLVVLYSVPQFERAAANAHAVSLEGCNLPGRSVGSRRTCLQTYSGTDRDARSQMRVAKGPVRNSHFFRYEVGKGAFFILDDSMLKELTPSGVLMIRLTFKNYETYDDEPADPKYVAELDIPFVDIPSGLAMIRRPCE